MVLTMKDGIKLYLSELKRNKTRRRKALGIFCVLAIMVAAGVFWRLRIIGITKTAEPTCAIPEHVHSEECILSKTLICGFEDDTADDPSETDGKLTLACTCQPHVHTPECFDMFGDIVCGNADYVIHQHNNLCFDESGMLICTLSEVLPHIHTDVCYEDTTTWSCGYAEGEETAVHTHTDECYETQSTLICTLAEDETHTHTPECYTEEKLLVCTLPETEAHMHNESCAQTTERKLVCGLPEIAVHMHAPECYDDMGMLVCGQLQTLEHFHTVECLPQSAPENDFPDEDSSVLPDGALNGEQEPHVHTDECYEVIYKCGYEEHIHDILCYADYNADLETEENWKDTIPSDSEFEGTRSDYMVEIALSQLGYAESKRNFIIDQQGIRRGYTRYGQWYNNPYGPWNTSFVSFCMHYAGIGEDEIPPASGAFQMLIQLDSLGRFIPHTYEDPMGDYEPVPGDIIFTDINGDGMPDRTGIIAEVIGDRIEVIEGDVGDNDYISDSEPELYEGFGGSIVSQLGLMSAEDIFVDDSGFDSMPTDLLLSDSPIFDTTSSMPEEVGNMADTGFYSDSAPADPTADPITDPVFDIPEVEEEDVVLDEYEPLGYVWDDESIPTHSVARVSYEKSDSAIVGYGIVSDGEEAELYTSLGGYELYTGDYTDLSTLTNGVAIVNVASSKAMVLNDEYVEASDGTVLPPAEMMWFLKKSGTWLENGYRFTVSDEVSLCINVDRPQAFIVTSDIWMNGDVANPNKPNMALEIQNSNDNTFKIRVNEISDPYNYIGFVNNQFVPTDVNSAAVFSLYDNSGTIAAVDTANAIAGTSNNDKKSYYIATTDGKVLTHNLTSDGKLESFPLRSKKTTTVASADFNPAGGSNSALIWSLPDAVDGNNIKVGNRIQSNSEYVPIAERIKDYGYVIGETTKEYWGSKYKFIPKDNYVIIESLKGDNSQAGYYLYLDSTDGKFKYNEFSTEDEAADDPSTHFQLYVPKTVSDNLSDYAHYYVVATRNTKVTDLDNADPNKDKNYEDVTDEHLVTIMRLYAEPGDKLRLSFQDGAFNAADSNVLPNLSAKAIDSNVGDIDFGGVRIDKKDNNKYYDYIITANNVGRTTIYLTAKSKDSDGYPTEKIVRVELQVGDGIEKTFKGKENPYHHLDVEVEANFKIKIYNEDPKSPDEYITIEPTDIEVKEVYAKVYNTGKLVGNEWNRDYMKEPGKAGKEGRNGNGRPTWNAGNYVNPWEKVRKYNIEEEKWYFTDVDNDFWNTFEFGMTAPKRDGTPASSDKLHGDYVENDTYNGKKVDSVTITYNESEKQPNGQLEFLTYGWGWTQFYDGDTVELYCVINYKYKEKTYKANYVVTRLICDTTNVCPSAFDYETLIHGFDIDVIIDDIIEVESNELIKVDQYGKGVPGVEFDFYPADANYNVAPETLPVSALHVKTDENGRFQFTKTVSDEKGREQTSILSLREFKSSLGGSDHFVMRESSTPKGYRSIPKEAHLYFEGSVNDGGKELFVRSANAFDSGVIANATGNVIAPQTLHKPGASPGIVGEKVEYYEINPNTGDFTFNGDLYAVVLKRNGANPYATSVNDFNLSQWSPVYGDDLTGYTVVKPDTSKNQIAADIVKELIKENKGVYKLEPNITGRFCSASVSNLPGQLTRYYTYMYNMRTNHLLTQEDINNLEYIVSYYYVPYVDGSPNVDGAYRINSHDVDTGNEFKIHWATTIEAPNFTNNLYFQKTNSNGDLLDDAYFALYKAEEITTTDNKTITCLVGEDGYYYDLKAPTIANSSKYIGKAARYDSSKNYLAEYDYEIDCSPYGNGGMKYEVNGLVDKPCIGQVRIKVGSETKYINPVPRTDDPTKSYVGYTHSAHESADGKVLDCITAGAQGGTGHFVRLDHGKYVLMEIKPPAGYNINPEKVKVRVTEKGVFANAGTKEDGIIVAKGVGYLAETMTSYASRGNINESLTWIAAHLNINPNDSYAAIDDPKAESWRFASPANETYNGKTHRAYKALYRGEKEATLYLKDAMVTYLVYDPQSQNYTDTSGNITTNRKLFEYAVNLGKNPKDPPIEEDYNNGQLARTSISDTINGNTITARETGDGTGTLRLYTDIGWSFLSIYQDAGYALQDGIRNPTSLYNDLTQPSDRLQYLFSNATYVQVTDPVSVALTVVKEGKDPDNPDDLTKNKPLPNAEFRLYKTVEGKQYFYKLKEGVSPSGSIDSSDIEWTADESEATIMTSELKKLNDNSEKALFRIYGLGIGEYTLEETKAPDGYTCASPQKINIEVDKGRIVFKFNGIEQTKLPSENNLYDVSLGAAEIQQYAVTVIDGNGLQLDVYKVDSTNNNHLSGAEFILYKKVTENDTEKTYYYSPSGNVIWVEGEDNALKLSSTANEPIHISGIAPGTYYLRETKAPLGYNALTADIEITVSDKNEVSVSGTGIKCERDSDSSTSGVIIYKITVPNTTGYALPETGGTGTQIYTYSGIIIMLAALVLSAVKKPLVAECVRRRCERRTEK